VGRNLLHNPLFNVAQRGAGPFTANGAYTLDRWQLNLGAGTASVAAFGLIDADRTAIGDEQVSTALRNVFTGNAAGDGYMIHKVENVSRLSGKTVTLSLWARSGVALKLGLNLAQVFGTGGSPSAPVWATAVAASVTPTWTRYSATFALPSAAGKTFGTNGDSSTWVTLWYSAGTTNNALSGNIGVQSGTIDVWGVQLEIGSAATPLEKPDPRYDLANAQRFYQTGQIISAANVAAGGAFYASAYFAVAMRTAPTIATNTNTSVNIGAITWLALTNGSGAAATTAATAAGAVSINATFTASADL
jgi:hypothetical protein